MSLPTLLWILSITFYWRLKISSRFVEMKLNLIPQLFLVLSFFEKIILLCQNEVWSSTVNKIPAFNLTRYEQLSSYNPHYISHMVCCTFYHSICIKSLSLPLGSLTTRGFWIHVSWLPNIIYLPFGKMLHIF